MLKLKKILFPVDFSERTAGAAHYVEALTGRFNAELTLLHVVESADYLYGTLEFGGSALTDFHAERLAHSRKQLDSYLTGELGHFQVRRVLLEGDPAQKIVEYAAQEGIDMIMMPSHGLGHSAVSSSALLPPKSFTMLISRSGPASTWRTLRRST